MHIAKRLVIKIIGLVMIGAFGVMATGCIVVPHDEGYHGHHHERHHHHYSERVKPFL